MLVLEVVANVIDILLMLKFYPQIIMNQQNFGHPYTL